ncbi:MAG: redox-sensing transcriptional repressor Rex [Fibrobacter sp.]|nr:redox-sensing transcriptional repressor Rex [Fibrobacter sp.]
MKTVDGTSIETIRRLPAYYGIAQKFYAEGATYVSSVAIASHLNIDSIIVRKDIQQIGIEGKPKLGYEASALVDGIAEFLGWNRKDRLILAGCGALGSALLGYSGFKSRGYDLVAGFDTNPSIIGTQIHGKDILPLSKMIDLCLRMHITIGIIAVPSSAAQSVADLMVKSGIIGIWNFTPVPLKVPQEVIVQQEDLVSSLVILLKKLEKEMA